MQEVHKAILVVVNSQGQLLIQDREGHKPPAWGFWGGRVEEGETPNQAIVRESKEELDLDITLDDVQYLGALEKETSQSKFSTRHFYLYRTDQTEFNVLEGAGAHWFSADEVREKVQLDFVFDWLEEKINEVIK